MNSGTINQSLVTVTGTATELLIFVQLPIAIATVTKVAVICSY